MFVHRYIFNECFDFDNIIVSESSLFHGGPVLKFFSIRTVSLSVFLFLILFGCSFPKKKFNPHLNLICC